MNFFPLKPKDLGLMPSISRPNLCEDTRGIVAVKDGEPVAIAVFDSWSFNSCRIHIWIEDAFVLKHGFAEEVFNFVFNGSERTKIIGLTPSDNDKALKFITHIGFEELFRIEDGYKIGVDYVVTEMKKENCRYIDHG